MLGERPRAKGVAMEEPPHSLSSAPSDMRELMSFLESSSVSGARKVAQTVNRIKAENPSTMNTFGEGIV